MALNLIAIGTKMPSWINDGIAEYAKRFPPEARLNLIEIPAEKRPGNIASIKTRETEKLFSKTKSQHTIIALDETGKQMDSVVFSKNLQTWMTDSVDFLMGGPDGFDKTLLKKADCVLSLSPLTLPHPLARLVLVEQLYRGLMLLKGHPYHRS